MSDVKSNDKYYPFLDGFRAVAILWVIVHHVFNKFDLQFLLGSAYEPLFYFSFFGFLGVDMFFVISGFLITGLLMEDLARRIRFKRFYARRFFKIVPHYLFVVAAGVVVAAVMRPPLPYDKKDLFYYFFFLQNYHTPLSFLGHMWSLAVEEHFYLVYPLLLNVVCLTEPRIASRRRWLVIIFLGLILTGIVTRYYCLKNVYTLGNASLVQFTHVRFDALLFGCLIKIFEPRLRVAGVVLGKIAWGPFLYFVAGISFYIVACAKPKFFPLWLFLTLAYGTFGFFLISALQGFWPLRILTENKGLGYIGKNSYGIYLWHYLLLVPLSRLFPRPESWGIILIYLALSLGLGILTTQTIERYSLNLRKRFFP